MSGLEPVRPHSRQVSPAAETSVRELRQLVASAGFFEGRRLGREARQELFDEELRALRTALKLHHLGLLVREQLEYDLALVEDIMRRLEQTTSPLAEQALMHAYGTWRHGSQAVLARYSLY